MSIITVGFIVLLAAFITLMALIDRPYTMIRLLVGSFSSAIFSLFLLWSILSCSAWERQVKDEQIVIVHEVEDFVLIVVNDQLKLVKDLLDEEVEEGDEIIVTSYEGNSLGINWHPNRTYEVRP